MPSIALWLGTEYVAGGGVDAMEVLDELDEACAGRARCGRVGVEMGRLVSTSRSSVAASCEAQ